MRTLTWFLGALVFAQWASFTAQLGHRLPWTWWTLFVLWSFLGLVAGAAHAVRWAIRMYQAGVSGGSQGARAGAPAVVPKEHT